MLAESGRGLTAYFPGAERQRGHLSNQDVRELADMTGEATTARVQRAKRLIDETSLPMTEIAVRAGFGSLRRFNSVFAEIYGRPPTKIRRTR